MKDTEKSHFELMVKMDKFEQLLMVKMDDIKHLMVEIIHRQEQLASKKDIKRLEEEFENKLETLRQAVQVIHYHFNGD